MTTAALLLALSVGRTYWPVDLATYAQNGAKHTHIELKGWVTYTAFEDDGDLHVRLCDSPTVVGMDKAHCVIAECIPLLPCTRPAKGRQITVRGISRHDPEHGWWEAHPLESWIYN